MFATHQTKRTNEKKQLAGAYVIAGGFTLIGVVIVCSVLRDLGGPVVVWKNVLMKGIGATIFGGVGVVLFFAMRWSAGKERRETELQELHPDEPWMWKEDWASGRINCSQRLTVISAWVFASLWNLIATPCLIQVPDEVLKKENYAALFALLFPLVGIGLLAWAIRATILYRKFGTSVLELAYVPGEIGGRLEGIVHVETGLSPEEGFQLKLTCLQRCTSGTGKNRSTTERVLWEETAVMDRELLEGDSERSAVPVSFEIPRDARPSSTTTSNSQIIWQLEMIADAPGIDYKSLFDVPVFASGAPQVETTSDIAKAFRRPDLPADVRRRDSRIAVAPLPGGGKEFSFPAARNPGAAVGLSLFSVLWGSTIFVQLYCGFGWFFPLLTGLFLLLLLWISADLWFGTSHVVFDGRTVRLRAGYFGGGRSREIPYEDVEEIKLGIGMQSGRTPYYDVELHAKRPRTQGRQLKSPLKLYAGRHIRDKIEVEWLADQMRECLNGRATEAHPQQDTTAPVTT